MMKNKTTTAKLTTMSTGVLTTMLFLFTLGMLSHTVSEKALNQPSLPAWLSK